MDHTIAYISEGKLYVREPDGLVRAVESPFVRDLLDRDERQRNRDGWKQNSAGWQATNMNALAAAEMGMDLGTGRRIAFTSVASHTTPGQCLYAIHTGTVGGLFEFTMPEDERRLVHKPDLYLQDICLHPMPNAEGVIACSMQSDSGAAHLAMMNADGGRLREITEGDSRDECPSWVPVPGKVLVYQSAGIARDLNGTIRAMSAYRVERLDLDRGEIETLLEQDGVDYLMPRCDDRQTLYCIRRPYRDMGHNDLPLLTRLKYAALWPFGVLAAFGAYLNFFSTMYRGKPLTPAGGPKNQRAADAKQMFLWGRRIAADKAIQDARDQAAVTVPRDWELIRVDATGNQAVLATGVGAFDLTDDGSIIYTDGTRIFCRSKNGETTELARHELVERVAVVRPGSADDA